jgi:ATP-dependent RNA helicase MSS116
LAQAKTGTGKTLAFLLPVLQNVLDNDPQLARPGGRFQRSKPGDIRALIISPTRELAEQIAVEARKVASSTGIVVQTAVGGTQKREGLRRILMEGCHVLVGTPGRLKDILSDPDSGVRAPKLGALVLDEADRLLDDGFGPEIEEIQTYLPDPSQVDRQTLMFSATVPREVMGMVRRSMKPDYKFVKTVSDNEVPTHLSVPQKAVFLRGFENALPAVLEIAKKYVAQAEQNPSLRPFKAIVYFNVTADVQLAYEVFKELLNDPMDRRSGHPLGRYNVFQMQSRLSQGQRTKSSESFRRSKSSILLSSDVTARGMDFPDVTHVIQIGTPRNRESYIHRLGRTARANKSGEGWILLHDQEYSDFRQKVGDLPIKDDGTIEVAGVDMGKQDQNLPASMATTLSQVSAAMKLAPLESKQDSYRAQLGSLMGLFDSKRDMIRAMNTLALNGWGMTEPPKISESLAQKLGIARIQGLNIGHDARELSSRPRDSRSRDSSRSRDPFGGRLDFGRRGGFQREGGSQGEGGFQRGGRSRRDGYNSENRSSRGSSSRFPDF